MTTDSSSGGDVELAVENRVVVGDLRGSSFFLSYGRQKRPLCVSCRPTSRSSVLPKRSRWASVRRSSRAAAPFSARRDVVVDHADLIRIGAAVFLHRERLAAPDQFRPALAKVLPAAEGVLGRLAVGGAVPPFHRVNAPAVADDETADINRLRQRRLLGGGEDSFVAREMQAEVQQVPPKRRHVFEMADLRVIPGCFVRHATPRSPVRCSTSGRDLRVACPRRWKYENSRRMCNPGSLCLPQFPLHGPTELIKPVLSASTGAMAADIEAIGKLVCRTSQGSL